MSHCVRALRHDRQSLLIVMRLGKQVTGTTRKHKHKHENEDVDENAERLISLLKEVTEIGAS